MIRGVLYKPVLHTNDGEVLPPENNFPDSGLRGHLKNEKGKRAPLV